MIKKIAILVFIFFAVCFSKTNAQYSLFYQFENAADSVKIESLQLKKQFTDKDTCYRYIQHLPAVLLEHGFIAASVDSVVQNEADTKVFVYLGAKYIWHKITIDEKVKQYLKNINIPENYFSIQKITPQKIQFVQQQVVQYLETIGYPFAKVYLDSVQYQNEQLSAVLKVKTEPLITIDSIEIVGDAKISKDYLSRFLGIKTGSVYNKNIIQNISKQLKLLNYIEEKQTPQIVWKPTGATVQLFIDQKKSSRINVIVGVLPNTQSSIKTKTVITGEANILLENAIGSGEKISFNWQKLPAASQNLQVAFQYPYLLKSPFGIDVSFDMIKRDSSFLNIDLKIGTEYAHTNNRKLKIFFNQFSTIANAINKAEVIQTKQLPAASSIQYSSFGLGYSFNNTNYIFNPISGWDIDIFFTGGNKNIKKNNQILQLKDPENADFNFASLYDSIQLKSIQSRNTISIYKYTPIGKTQRVSLKSGVNIGMLYGKHFFSNELFQIGGSVLLRGFNDHSEFLSNYILGTMELRYLIGKNSYFNIFSDGGWGNNNTRYAKRSYSYLSGGLGLAFEAKAGVFNIAWAVGKRNDSPFSLKQSKIHFGFASYF